MDISWEDSIKSGHDKINREQMRHFVASQIKQAIYRTQHLNFFIPWEYLIFFRDSEVIILISAFFICIGMRMPVMSV